MNNSKSRKNFNGKYKLTWQREVIFKTLDGYAGRHLSAEDIYEIIHGQYPKIGLATVYRTMELFSTLNIVQKLDFGDGCQRYERYSPLRHHHLLCNSCGKVIEIKGNSADAIDMIITAISDFSVLDYQLYIHGYCKDCQTKRNPMGTIQNTIVRSNVI